MKPFHIILFLVALGACKSSQRAAGGNYASADALITAFQTNLPLADAYQMRGSGTFEQNGQSNSFRFDMRMRRDSTIYLELMDPILGIKALRLWVAPDTLVAINLLERWFVREEVGQLLARFPLGLDYQTLQNLLLARPAFGQDAADSLANASGLQNIVHRRMDGSQAVYGFAGQGPTLAKQAMAHPQWGNAECRYEYAPDDVRRIQKVLVEARRGQQTFALRLKYDVVRTQDVVVPATFIPPGYVVKAL
jgi:outer membrane biogenesis lipoprotein LolB